MSRVSEVYKNLFENMMHRLQNKTITEFLWYISFIYARIGYESGKIMRIMLQKEINWGYFKDHHPYMYHCNAHPNNMVVLDKEINSENLIGPLDFDLAFSKREFININADEFSYGKYDSKLFDSY